MTDDRESNIVARITRHHIIMKTWIAILSSIGLAVACTVISVLIDFNIVWITVIGTALWCGD